MLEVKTYRGPCPNCCGAAHVEQLCSAGWEAGEFSTGFIIVCENDCHFGETYPTAELAVVGAREIAQAHRRS